MTPSTRDSSSLAWLQTQAVCEDHHERTDRIREDQEERGQSQGEHQQAEGLLGKTNWFKKKSEKETEIKTNRNKSKLKRASNIEAPAQPPVVPVLFVPKTGGSVLQKRLQELEPGLSAISGERCATWSALASP